MTGITLHGKPAVKVNAELITWANTQKSQMYNIDGDEAWVPYSVSEFTRTGKNESTGMTTGTLVIQEWKYKQLFPNG